MGEVVQYYVVNQDLTMSAGKVAAQVAHAATQAVLVYHQNQLFREWLETGQTKIILKASENTLNMLIKEGFVYIKDAGRTEIASGSLTVVALPPLNKDEAKKYTQHLSLYS
ncbi:aminoacyl-tRNA hydrolase [Aquibacillus kalidii]|uniref:aminoacyl-tRNA hydrolase n=1 Tax=Aquibacillus kalidii TaxID=2762597 RepID=UPI001648E79C|nr:aminoacyl-tRNA hydrolase [Aquibacillus kalidii]